MQYTIVNQDGEQSITIIIPGAAKPLIARGEHPNFEKIVAGVLKNDESVKDLFDISSIAGQKFERLSERVSVAHGRIYFDNDEVDSALGAQVLRFVTEKVGDWKPLVAFWEKVASNPNEHSRKELYGFIEKSLISISDDGDIVAYKGVNDEGDGEYRSVQRGTAIVNGETVNGHIPNPIGGVIEMPRSVVKHEPSAACHVGLHVATFNFAKGWSGTNTVLEVRVNPRDVVSVPQYDKDKIRCCRYKIIGLVEQPQTKPVIPTLTKTPVPLATDSDYRIPTNKEFDELVTTAKQQKKGIKALAAKRGWVLVQPQFKDRKSYRILKKKAQPKATANPHRLKRGKK